jgi:hypothetical protein
VVAPFQTDAVESQLWTWSGNGQIVNPASGLVLDVFGGTAVLARAAVELAAPAETGVSGAAVHLNAPDRVGLDNHARRAFGGPRWPSRTRRRSSS